MDIDTTLAEDAVEIAVETTPKVVANLTFATGVVAGAAAAYVVVTKVVPTVRTVRANRAAKKAAKKQS